MWTSFSAPSRVARGVTGLGPDSTNARTGKRGRWRGWIDPFRPVRRECDADHLRSGRPRPLVRAGLCCGLRVGLGLRLSAGRIAVWRGRGDLDHRGAAAFHATERSGPCMSGRDKDLRAIGLMSGTSMDGVDVALIESDGEIVTSLGPSG